LEYVIFKVYHKNKNKNKKKYFFIQYERDISIMSSNKTANKYMVCIRKNLNSTGANFETLLYTSDIPAAISGLRVAGTTFIVSASGSTTSSVIWGVQKIQSQTIAGTTDVPENIVFGTVDEPWQVITPEIDVMTIGMATVFITAGSHFVGREWDVSTKTKRLMMVKDKLYWFAHCNALNVSAYFACQFFVVV
jgi:hypothetical protein